MSDGGAGRRSGAPPDPARDGGPVSLLRVEEIRVRYDGSLVLDVDELELRDGELLVVVGPNGAGKSTLMRVMAMLEEPGQGRVSFRGRRGAPAADALRTASTAVFQRPHLWTGTVGDNLRLSLRFSGVTGAEAEERARETAAALELEGLLGTDVEKLSAGQRRRAALARALAPRPEVLFLDEPTANLDARARAKLRRDVERFARRGGRSTLLVTHDRREAFRLADRIAVLEAGRRVRTGAPAELYERPGSPYVAEVSGAELTLRGRVVEHPDPDGEDVPAADGRAGGDEPPDRLLRVEVGGVRLLAIGRAGEGEEVTVSYRPEDLALAPAPGDGPDDEPGASPTGDGRPPDSVRNEFSATVRELQPARGLVRVRLSGPPVVVAVVTRGSREALGLAPGSRVRVRVKAAALYAFRR